MTELKNILKDQAFINKQPNKPPQTIVHNAPVTQNVNVTQAVYISPWAPRSTLISTADLIAVFAENPRLEEYCHLNDTDKIDAEGAAPYVLEALIEFVKRAHEAPSARNIYMNPRRADQVLVFAEEAGGSWKTLSLVEAIRALFDGVTGGIKYTIRQTRTLTELSQQIIGAASYVPMLYNDEPDEYVKKAKGPMVAHLTNTAPSAEAHVQLAQRPAHERIASKHPIAGPHPAATQPEPDIPWEAVGPTYQTEAATSASSDRI